MSVLPRSLAIFALCIPLAILLGVMLATPLDSTTMLFVGAAFLVLLSPVLLTHHHQVLVFSWNAFITVVFLPGQPYLWLLMVAVSLFFSVLTRTLNREKIKFLWVPSMTIPTIAIILVVLITAQLTGGIGSRALGSDVFGGKRYFYVLGALAGFFALTAKRVPVEKRQLFAGIFLLPAVTAFFSNFAYWLGPSFYWLFLVFPTEWVLQQAVGEQSLAGITRVGGLAPASMAVCGYILMRYGLKSLLDFSRPGALLIFIASAVAGLFSGFRSHIALLALILGFQFMAEGLYRTRYFAILLLSCALLFGVALPFSDQLPLAAQRALTILPLKLDPVARTDAQHSLDWRLDMWRVVANEIPTYFWLGKGYAINPTDLYLAEESFKRGISTHFDPAIISGDYHSGPFSILITFGIFGALAFLWFMAAAIRVLWRNYRYSEPEILNINRFFFAFFLARFVYYLVIFGALHVDLPTFIGIVGLSIALNGGIRSRSDLNVQQAPAAKPFPKGKLRALPEPVPA